MAYPRLKSRSKLPHLGVFVLDYLPTATNLKLNKHQEELKCIIQEIIDIKKENMDIIEDYPDIIQVLIDNQNTDKEIIGMVAPLFLAGFDTTANAMGMTMYYLSHRPDLQRKIQAEAMTIRHNEVSDLSKLQTLNACIMETLRLQPSVPMISREADSKCSFAKPGTAFGINLNLYGVHRSSEWPHTDKFYPERWLENTKKPLYCPFSLGKRSCLGKHFAMIEMQTVLKEILLRWYLIPISQEEPENLESGTLNMSPDFKLRFESTGYIQETQLEKENASISECKLRINGKVYDVTQYLDSHPGGNAVLKAYHGSDATREFESIHPKSTKRLLQKYLVK